MLDIHCHILPQVDDGAKNEEESLKMLEAAKASGIDRLIATPHFKDSKTDIKRIQKRFEWLKVQASQREIRAGLGFEVNTRVLPDLRSGQIRELCLAGTSLLLLEFQEDEVPPGCRQLLYQLEREGIQVIIAHPERYRTIQKDFRQADMLLEMGCALQVDAESLAGSVWSAERHTAVQLLKQGKVTFLASDAHCADDYQNFVKVTQKKKWMEQLIPSDWEKQFVF